MKPFLPMGDIKDISEIKAIITACCLFPLFDMQTQSYHLRWTDLVLMVEGISIAQAIYGKRYEKGSKTA